jgi:hypothetical protein
MPRRTLESAGDRKVNAESWIAAALWRRGRATLDALIREHIHLRYALGGDGAAIHAIGHAGYHPLAVVADGHFPLVVVTVHILIGEEPHRARGALDGAIMRTVIAGDEEERGEDDG